MMKLICNLSMLGSHPTGLGVYSENCVAGLANRFKLSLIAGTGSLPRGDVLVRAPESVAIGGGKYAAIRRQLWMRSLRIPSGDLVYSPTHHGLPHQERQIITVHDLICLRFPAQHRTQYLFFRFWLPHLLKKCRAVFTVSHTTRQGIAAIYDYPLDRIYVVPNGVDATVFKPDPLAKSADPFLLMVGARYQHKNVDEVLDMAKFWKQDYRLVVTSCSGSYRKKMEQKAANHGLVGQIEFKDYLSSDELLRLYQGASALLYPSLCEGFGIPPLEALACGTPVIASDIPVHREILGEAGWFVKLGDNQSWAEAFQLLASPSFVKERLTAGQILISKLTWGHAVDMLEQALLCVEPRLEAIRQQAPTTH
jgi:glycosyltransferase involved in cell wall biosynthesis